MPNREAEQLLIEKIRSLHDDKIEEVADFVEFLSLRHEDRKLTQAATYLARNAFDAVWDNDSDAAYDNL